MRLGRRLASKRPTTSRYRNRFPVNGGKGSCHCSYKINRYGTRYVFLTDRIGSTPFEVGAFEAIGRPFSPGPDYIYTLNTLYTLGIYPNVTILNLERDIEYASMDEAVKSYSWMFHDITPDENLTLEKYLTGKIIHAESGRVTIRRDSPPRWALIWWEKVTENIF